MTPHSEPLGWIRSHQVRRVSLASVRSTTLGLGFVLCYVKGEDRVVYDSNTGPSPTYTYTHVNPKWSNKGDGGRGELDHLVLTGGSSWDSYDCWCLIQASWSPARAICVELEGFFPFPFILLKSFYFLVPKQSKDSEHLSQQCMNTCKFPVLKSLNDKKGVRYYS